jgi:hypothetical protein
MIEKRTFNGYWNLPNSEDQVAGTFLFDPLSKSELQLLGHFNTLSELSQIDSVPLIHGFTVDGKQITLISCQRGRRSMSFPGIPTISYLPAYTLVGAHLQIDDKDVFNEIVVEIELLTKWIDIWGYAYLDNQDDQFTIQYKLLDDIEFNIDDNTKGAFTFSGSSTDQLEEEQRSVHKAKLKISCLKPIDLSDILEYAWHFKKLLTIATQSNTYYKVIKIKSSKHGSTHEDQFISKNLELLYHQRELELKVQNQRKEYFLFTYKDVEAHFATIIEQWFSKKEIMEPVINSAYVSYSGPQAYLENQFLSAVQALEVFHRRFRQKTELLKKEHATKWQTIISALSTEQQEYINKFEYAYEPGLTRRLKDLIKEFKTTTIKKLLGSSNETNDFIYKVVNSRNFYTHYDMGLNEKALKGAGLHYATEKLQLLLIIAILCEVGFDYKELEQLVSKLEPYKYMFMLKNK